MSEKKSIIVEQDRTTSIVCHMEAIRQEPVVEVFNCLLQCDNVPFPRNMFFDSSFFSTPRSWVSIINAESSLLCQSVGHLVVSNDTLERMDRVF